MDEESGGNCSGDRRDMARGELRGAFERLNLQ